MKGTATYVAVAIAALSFAGQALAVGGSMGGRMSIGMMSSRTSHQQLGGTGMQPGAGQSGSSMHAGMTAGASHDTAHGAMAGAASGDTTHGRMADTASSATMQGGVASAQSQMQVMPHKPAVGN